MQHGEQAIIAVWSRLPIKRSCEHKSDWCTREHTMQNDNEMNRIDIEMIMEMKQNINFLLAATVHLEIVADHQLSECWHW